MIKIKFFSDEIAKEYAEKILPEIKKRYEENKSELSAEIAKEIFLDSNGEFSEEKVKDLLILSRKELFSKNDFCKKYANILNVQIEYKRLETAATKKEKEKAGFTDQSEYSEYLIKNAQKPFTGITLPKKTFSLFKEKIKKIKDDYYKNDNFVNDAIINNEVIKNIITYDDLNDKLRHKIISSLNGVVCPYCNRQYITAWKDENDELHTTADLDHYYNKSDFPLFSLSLFNFVPSCQVCNSRMKGEKLDRTLYPYEEEFGDDARFAIEPKDKKKEIDVWLGNKNAEFDIKIKISESIKKSDIETDKEKKEHIENSINVFRLERVYQAHKEYVRELIIKKRVYDEGSYSDNMAVIFEKLGLDYSEAELKRFLYGSVSPDSDRPLSKLTCDIIKK